MPKKTQYNLRIDPAMLEEIELICESGAFGRIPISEFIRTAIREKLLQHDIRKLRAQRAAQRQAADRRMTAKKENAQ
jgi:Arc/MetJ-type ribon-helix-helix transcriptional regulator